MKMHCKKKKITKLYGTLCRSRDSFSFSHGLPHRHIILDACTGWYQLCSCCLDVITYIFRGLKSGGGGESCLSPRKPSTASVASFTAVIHDGERLSARPHQQRSNMIVKNPFLPARFKSELSPAKRGSREVHQVLKVFSKSAKLSIVGGDSNFRPYLIQLWNIAGRPLAGSN